MSSTQKNERSPSEGVLRREVVAAGLASLRSVVETGVLGCAVPREMGGQGGTLDQLAREARGVAERSQAAAWVLWAQRMAIEALVHSPNVGVSEHLLPLLLSGELAGALPLGLDARPLVAEEQGSAFRLYGVLDHVPNLQWIGFSLLCPIRQHGRPVEWVVLRSEEDGLRVGIDREGVQWYGSRTASVTVDGTFFRMDEWLGDEDLLAKMTPVMNALRPG